MQKKPFINLLLALMLGFAMWTAYRHVTVMDPKNLDLQNGDLIFQTKLGVQSLALHEATHSPYTHVGIIYLKDGRVFIIDAGNWGVRINRFDTWVSSGFGNKFMIKRRFYMNPQQQSMLIETALKWVGKAYDFQLNLNDDAFYGSEFPYKLYKQASMPFGKIQKISELDTKNIVVETLMRILWRQLSYCKGSEMTLEACKAKLLEQEIITPESLARDEKMVQIYSNF